MSSKSQVKRISTQLGLKTLADHNTEVGTAHVACDKCGAGMNYDRATEQREQQNDSRVFPHPLRDGKPVVCPKCGYTGRKLY
jgi:hypothetical protein